MSKRPRSRWILLAVAVLVVSALVWFGGDWLWHLFLRMHGMRGAH